MKRFFIPLLILLISSQQTNAQISVISLQHEIYQNNEINPAWFPANTWTFGIPVISGVVTNYNNRLRYSDVINRLDNDINQVDIGKTLDKLKINNYIGANVRINDLFIAYRKNSNAISFFINDRVETDLFFPRDLIDFAVNGNQNFLTNSLELDKLALNASHYREFGIGYTSFGKKSKFNWGYRLKLLSGFYNVSIPKNFEATLTTDPDSYALSLTVANADLRVTQVPEDGSFVLSPNLGFAVDAGFDYRVNEDVRLAFSVRDIGFIKWKDGVTHRELEDTKFTYNGVDIKEGDNLIDALEDSLVNKFNYSDDSEDAYRTGLPVRMNFTSTMRLTRTGELVMMLAPELVRGFVQMRYGAGVTQKLGDNFRFNVSANKLPQQGVNFGAALSTYFGPVQVYAGSDKLIGYDLTGLRSFNFTFGLNVATGRLRSQKWKSTRVSEFSTNRSVEKPSRRKGKVLLNVQKEKAKKKGGVKKPRKSRKQ